MILVICVCVWIGCVLWGGGHEGAERIWKEIKTTGGRENSVMRSFYTKKLLVC